ncbi:MAG: AAA family ATPase [Spirochaetia bacterium]|nr:AAA family ATPase [Spirochaetia bacterium]
MDLFMASANPTALPLAARMRPENLDDFIGQEHLVGKGRLLRRAIQADQLSSLIFYGPPGTGKTTLARIIAKTTKSAFITINAVLSGVKEIREAIIEAKKKLELYNQKTILFVDEVHRWNKAQQDALLPWVENGTFILIGATTENPLYEVNSALVSRSRIFQLLPLTKEDLLRAAEKAIADTEKGYGNYKIEFEKGSLEHLADIANGDARSMLNALELSIETTPEEFPPPEGHLIYVTKETAEESIQKKVLLYDKEGDYHFDTISAFIKSIRGSDPDAALFWMARMIDAGEDPRFILRRMIISAAEDIGLADPNALVFVNAAAQAYERIGMPEGQLILAETALYLACAKKSNTALSFFDALEAVREDKQSSVPVNLKDPSRDKESFGHGKNYLYPHAYRDHWVAQQYLPEALKGRIFYKPGDIGFEAELKNELSRRREVQLAAQVEREDSDEEILTFSPQDKKKDAWLKRVSDNKNVILSAIREEIYSQIKIRRYDRILVASADRGLLVWEGLRLVPEGGVFFISENPADIEIIEKSPLPVEETEKPVLIENNLAEYIENEAEPGIFDIITGKNIFLRSNDRAILADGFFSILDTGGRVSLAENLVSKSSRISQFLETSLLDDKEMEEFVKAEEAVYKEKTSNITGLNEDYIRDLFSASGFREIRSREKTWFETRFIQISDIEKWFNIEKPGSYGSLLSASTGDALYNKIKGETIKKLAGREVKWKSVYLFVSALKD